MCGVAEIFGKLFADRGYISQKLFEKLLKSNITLMTRAKKNMKNKLIYLYDRLMLRKRTVIESVNYFLKNICDIEHSRHRSVTNFLVNLVSALTACFFLPKNPYVCSSSDMSKVFYAYLTNFFNRTHVVLYTTTEKTSDLKELVYK